MTQSEIEAAIDKILAAIASSSVIQSMTVAGQQYQFRTIADMERALALFRRELAALQGRGSSRLAATRKGA